MMRPTVVAGALLALLGAEANGCHCSIGGLNMERVEEAIKGTLEKEGFTVTSVECPESAPLKKGHEFSCTATVGDQAIPMKVTQTDAEGGVSYEPEFMVVNVGKFEAGIKGQPGFDAATSIDCEGEAWVSEPGASYTCGVTAHGEDLTVSVTFKDENGGYETQVVPK